jgi:hypothetical protein
MPQGCALPNEHPSLARTSNGFECDGDRLVGVAQRTPTKPVSSSSLAGRAVPAATGGCLLARHLAAQDIASIHFDYRGMGDEARCATSKPSMLTSTPPSTLDDTDAAP